MSKIFSSSKTEVPTAAPVVEEEAKKTKKLRTALYATEGQALGQELMSGQTSQRNTFFGN